MAVGMIVAGLTSNVPGGWLLCDGSTYPNEEYPALAALLGQTFGPGTGGPSFQLPDLRSQFVRGLDFTSGGQPPTGRDPDVASRTPMVPGTTASGPSIGSLQGAQIGEHSHTVSGLYNVTICCPWVCAYFPDNTQGAWGSTDAQSVAVDMVPRYTEVVFLIQAA